MGVDEIRHGIDPESAARRVIEHLSNRVGSTGGIILVDATGRVGFARSTPSMAWGAAWQGGPGTVADT